MTHWSVPIEAIKAGADFAGTPILARLAAERAIFHRAARVELGPHSFIATTWYRLPGDAGRLHVAHLGLVWRPSESLELTL